MFFNGPGQPTKLKKAIYLITSTILGFFLSLIGHAVIEINYLDWVLSQERIVHFYGGCALPPVLQAALWIIGGVSGFLLGRFWWRKVYIERVWAQKKM